MSPFNNISKIFARPLASVLFAALLAGCSSIGSDPGSRSLGSVIDDQSIEATAAANIRKIDPSLQDANVVVTSYNGTVLLSGQIPNEDLRAQAAHTAAAVKSVKRVYNELGVGPNKEFTVRSSDTLLTAKVKSRLLAAKGIKDSRVKVVTENGSVYLLGLVTQEEGDIASKVTQETGGVQRVVRMFEYVE